MKTSPSVEKNGTKAEPKKAGKTKVCSRASKEATSACPVERRDAPKPTHGVLVVGHGSRMEFNKSLVTYVAKILNTQKEFGPVIPAFLEFNEPDLKKGIELLAEKGVDVIYVQPCLLTNGTHFSNDIPAQLGVEENNGRIVIKNHTIRLRYCKPIGNDERIAEILAERVRESMMLSDGATE